MATQVRPIARPQRNGPRTRGRTHWLVHFLLWVGVLIILFPLAWGVLASFKTTDALYTFPPKFWPDPWTLGPYVEAWNFAPIWRFLLNSAIQAGGITIGQLITATLAAYAFARLRFRGREILFYAVLATMMIPLQVIMIPLFAMVSDFGWVDTHAGLIVPFVAHAFSIFLLRQYFLAVPQDLEDAAMIDGCGRLRFLLQIMVPIARPALGAVAIFTFIYHWNTYLWPLLITSSETMRTVQPGLALFVEREAGTDFGRLMAASFIIALPTIIPFLIAQRQFIRGITMSGLKG